MAIYIHVTNTCTISIMSTKVHIGSLSQYHRDQLTYIFYLFSFLGQIPIVQLNFAALAYETPFDRDNVESCVKEVLQALSRSIQAKRNVEFHFSGMGRLSIRDSKVKMKFYKEFVKSMDGSGSLLRALSNVSR